VTYVDACDAGMHVGFHVSNVAGFHVSNVNAFTLVMCSKNHVSNASQTQSPNVFISGLEKGAFGWRSSTIYVTKVDSLKYWSLPILINCLDRTSESNNKNGVIFWASLGIADNTTQSTTISQHSAGRIFQLPKGVYF
jgi:hypothetical protein